MSLDIRVLSDAQEEFDGFYAIYCSSFPQHEQKSKETLLHIKDSLEYTIFLAYHDEKIVGFSIMYHPIMHDFFLLEYVAIDETLRGIGVGSSLLKESFQRLIETYGNRPIVIEIDLPNHENDRLKCQKREEFYRRLGALKIENLTYILPLDASQPQKMELMLYNYHSSKIPKATLHLWVETLYVHVYGCAKNDPRIIKMFENSSSFFRLT